jgi:hypothetical protein
MLGKNFKSVCSTIPDAPLQLKVHLEDFLRKCAIESQRNQKTPTTTIDTTSTLGSTISDDGPRTSTSNPDDSALSDEASNKKPANIKIRTFINCKNPITTTKDPINNFFNSFDPLSSAISKFDFTNCDNKFNHVKSFLKNIKNDASIIIAPSDKGGRAVILDVDLYKDHASKILNSDNYNQTSLSQILKTHKEFRDFLRSLVNSNMLTSDNFVQIYITDPRIPKLRLLPKIHKENLCFRPLVDNFSSFNYFLAKFLDTILKHSMPPSEFSIFNSGTLKSDFLSLPPDFSLSHLVSIDIVNLFPSIPLDEVIQIAKDMYINDPNRLGNFDSETFELLLNWSAKTFILFDSKYYVQTNGLSMGSPLSPTLAEIYMRFIEKHILFHHPNLLFYKRYVDDSILIFKGTSTSFSRFVNNLNKINPHIKFSFEWEIDNSIPFLDILITRIPGHGFEMEVFHKSISSIIPPVWSSYHPKHQLIGTLKGFISRALNLSTRRNALLKDLNFIFRSFKAADYPTHMIIDTMFNMVHDKFGISLILSIHDSVLNNPVPSVPTPIANTPQTPSYISATFPYIPGISDQIGKFIKQQLHVFDAPFKARITFKPHLSLKKFATNNLNLSSESVLQRKGVVYAITCKQCQPNDNSPILYIGETSQQLIQRIRGHLYNTSIVSPVRHHMLYSKHSKPQVSILAHFVDTNLRKFAEAFFIQSLHPIWNSDAGVPLRLNDERFARDAKFTVKNLNWIDSTLR